MQRLIFQFSNYFQQKKSCNPNFDSICDPQTFHNIWNPGRKSDKKTIIDVSVERVGKDFFLSIMRGQ